MRADRSRHSGVIAFALAGVAACDRISSLTSGQLPVEWDCPAIDCATLESSATCASGVCSLPSSEANTVVALRLPANSNVSPGAFVLAQPVLAASGRVSVSLPTRYGSEQGIVVSRDAAAALGWSPAADVAVPAAIHLDPLVGGRFALSSLLPRPLVAQSLETWEQTLASSPLRAPDGGPAVTAHAVVFQGSYARSLAPLPPFDETLPPFVDTLVVPGGNYMHPVNVGTLTTVSLPFVELPTRGAGWTLALVDARGVRRSSVVRAKSLAGPVSFRVATAPAAELLALDLVIEPGDVGVTAPRLVIPTPSALSRISYPLLPPTSRATFKVVLPSGDAAANAFIALQLEGFEPVSGDPYGVFAAYARGDSELRTDQTGVVVATVPFGALTAVARTVSEARLSATRELPLFFNRETASVTLKPDAPRSIDGTCAFAGGKRIAGASVEARAIDEGAAATRFDRVAAVTLDDGSFHLDLPDGAFAFWFHAPAGAPVQDVLLGRDSDGASRLTQVPCRLRAPVRRTLTILDAAPQIGAPIGSAIVETFRFNGIADPVWLGEGVSHPDGRTIILEAPP